MGEHQLALLIDDETKRRLDVEAQWGSQSEAEILADALKAHLDHQDRLRKALDAAALEADNPIRHRHIGRRYLQHHGVRRLGILLDPAADFHAIDIG